MCPSSSMAIWGWIINILAVALPGYLPWLKTPRSSHMHHQCNYLRCLDSRWLWVVDPSKLEPKVLMQANLWCSLITRIILFWLQFPWRNQPRYASEDDGSEATEAPGINQPQFLGLIDPPVHFIGMFKRSYEILAVTSSQVYVGWQILGWFKIQVSRSGPRVSIFRELGNK